MSKKNKKAFVNGVNVLDSDPKAYKYVKKKIKSAGDGDKLDLTPLDLDTLYKKYKEVGNNRYMDTLLLRQVDNLLIKRKMGKPQRLAIFVTAGQEGSTIKSHGNGATGLVGWRGTRAESLPSTAEGQADKIYEETYGPFSSDNWNHGGLGSGYKTAREALLAFLNAATPEEAIKALNFGYVRPPKSETLYRINLMKKLYKRGGLISKAQEGTKFLNFIGNISNFLKSDTGLSIVGGVGLLFKTFKPSLDLEKQREDLNKWKNAYIDSIVPEDASLQVEQEEVLAKQANPDYNSSPIYKAWRLNQIEQNSILAARQKAAQQADMYILNKLLEQLELNNESLKSGIEDLFNKGFGMLSLYIGNKNNTPSVVTPIKDYAKDFKLKTDSSVNNSKLLAAMTNKDITYKWPSYTLPSSSDYKFSCQK